MNSLFAYKAFGLVIQSELECPELLTSCEKPNVFIKFGVVPKGLESVLFSGVRFQTNGNEFLLNVDNIARYLVKDGSFITIEVYPEADPAEVRLFLLGSAFGALIHQRGLLPFHGSSIKIADYAIILSGLSGAGKSTIAAAFQQKGYPILSDDVTVISCEEDGKPIVHPGYPQMKLWADSILNLGGDPAQYKKTRKQLEKHYIPIKDAFWNSPLPLSKIYVINASNLGELKIEKVKGVEKFSLLKTHTYRFNFAAGKEINSLHFRSFDLLAKTVEMAKLTRPSGKFIFDKLIDLILNE